MAIGDLQLEVVPIDEPSQEVVEPLDEVVPTTADEDDKKVAIAGTQAATAISVGSKGFDAYQESIISGDTGHQELSFQEQVSTTRAQNIVQGSDVEEIDITMNKAVVAQDNFLLGSSGFAREDIRNHPVAVEADTESVNDMGLRSEIRHNLSRFASTFTGEGALDSMASIGGLFIPERESLLLADVFEQAGFINGFQEKAGVIAVDTDDVRKFRNFYAGLNLEDKALIIKQFGDIIADHGDNPLVNDNAMRALFADTFEDENWRTVFNVLDATVVADVFGLASLTVKGLVKGSLLINQAVRLKDAKAAIQLIQESAVNSKDYAKMGHKMANGNDAMDITMPTSARHLLTGADESMAAEIVQMWNLQDARIASVLKTRAREGVLTPDEQKSVMAKTETAFEKKDTIKSGSVSIKEVDGKSFDITYKTQKLDKKGVPIEGKFVKETKNVPFTTKGIKGLKSAEDEYINGILRLDPNARMSGKLRHLFVSLIERVNPEQARLVNALDQSAKDAFKGLNKKSAARVDVVLKRGAKDKRNYTYDELTNPDLGIGSENLTLTDKEAKAYLGYRNVMDRLHSMENSRFTENLSIRGISIADLGENAVPAKAYETPDGAWSAFYGSTKGDNDSAHILVMGNNFQNQTGKGSTYRFEKFSDLDDGEMVANWYEKGYQLMKVDNPQQLFSRGQVRTQWALVKKTDIVDPRGAQVLNRIEGYVPKSRTNGHFYIKTNREGLLSGAKASSTRTTAAWSDNMADAQRWVDDQARNGDEAKYEILSDREIPSDELLYDTNHSRGGMHSGARKTEEIEFVGQDGNADFANSFEALQGYINHIGKQYPINMMRMGMEARSLATANEITNSTRFTKLPDLINPDKIGNLSNKTQALMKDMHDQISFISNIPTSAEVATSKRILELGKAIEGSVFTKIPGFDTVPKFLYRQSGRGLQPVDVVRSVTFMHMLGLYNPAQLLIQASGAFVAFAINPQYFLKAMPRTIGFSQLDILADNPEALKKGLDFYRKNGMDEFADGYELWARTGLRENVVNSNADYTSVWMKNLPYDANIAQKIMSKHTVFYEQGELTNTRYAFNTAIEWYKAKNGVKKTSDLIGDDNALNRIIERTEIYRLNMGRANQSDLNKGMKSIPLQFKQVISKYFEKVLPKGLGGTDELTGLEKIQLGSIPTALAGVTGIPLLEPITVEMMDMAGITPESLTPGEASLFKFGVLGWMNNEVFNVNVDMTSRMSLGTDVFKDTIEVFTQGQSVWKALGGPAANVAKRYASNLEYTFKAFDLYTDIDEETTFKQDLAVGTRILVDALADIPTLSRNIKDYYAFMMINNPAFMKNGQYLIDFETMNGQTAFFAIAGFQPTELTEAYEASSRLREMQGGMKGATPFFDSEAKLIARLIQNMYGAQNDQERRAHALIIRGITRNRPASQWGKLNKQVSDIMSDPKLDQYQTYKDLVLHMIAKQEEGFGFINTTMSRQNQRTQGK